MPAQSLTITLNYLSKGVFIIGFQSGFESLSKIDHFMIHTEEPFPKLRQRIPLNQGPFFNFLDFTLFSFAQHDPYSINSLHNLHQEVQFDIFA